MENLEKMSDKNLLWKCEQYGRAALIWRNRFRTLLPEVERRKLYLRKGFASIYEFGKKLAGLSEAQVSESLNIAPRLHDKPELKNLLESGEVSINKIARIIPIATPENEKELAEKAQLLPLSALKTFVRDMRAQGKCPVDQKTENENIFLQELGLNDEMIKRLKELRRREIDINVELSKFLDLREAQIEEEKEKITVSLSLKNTRYIPVRTKALLKKEFGNKCAKSDCTKKAQHIHHTARYDLTYSHDPHFLAPLCAEHHAIAHAIDIKATDRRWQTIHHEKYIATDGINWQHK